MSEMMKRYEAEHKGIMPCVMEISGGFIYSKEYVTWLEAQLTWRPVSEKPDNADMYVVECKPYTGCDSTIVTTAWYDGERFPWNDVVKWLPIPPQGE